MELLTGIEGVNMPKNVKGGEMIRLNTSIPTTAIAQQDRLGLLAGQMDGFPNGRRLVMAVLQHQPASGYQVTWCPRDKLSDRIEAISA